MVDIVLAGTATYEAAFALGAVPLGSEPGVAPRGENVALLAGLLAMLVGIAACLANALTRRVGGGVAWALLAPASVALVVARYYAFDPYYAPSERRASDGGLVPFGWMLLLAIAAIATGLFTWRRPRDGSVLTAVVVMFASLTAFAVRLGH